MEKCDKLLKTGKNGKKFGRKGQKIIQLVSHLPYTLKSRKALKSE